MKKNVIYFPYIRVPQSEWFTRALIYYDQVSSIVPYEYIRSPKLGKYMDALIYENLVKPIIPRDYIYKIPNFTKAFLEYVDKSGYPVPKGIIRKKKVPTFALHMEKLGSIGDELCNRGLAYLENYPWYNIETYTANQFMAYLAATLGKLPEINSEPVTDITKNLASFAAQYHKEGKLPQRDELRTIILKDILPAPKQKINPSKLAKFKSDHKRELTRFRNNIKSFLINVSAIEDKILIDESVKQFIVKTRDEVDELKKLMESKGWRNITLGRFLAYSSAILGLCKAIEAGGLLGVVAAAFGVSSAIYVTIRDTMGMDTLEGKYTAFAVLAQKELKKK